MTTVVPHFISQMSRDWLRPLQDQYGRHPFGNNAEQDIAARCAIIRATDDPAVPGHARQHVIGHAPGKITPQLNLFLVYFRRPVGEIR
jgi:hypothetical protein